MVADDLQRIIAERTEQIVNRKVVGVLSGVAFVLLVILLALSAALGVSSHSVARWNWLYGGDRCATPECLRTAAWISDSIDVDAGGPVKTSAARVDPCDDFYRFACGAWESRHSIPPDDSEVMLVDLIETDIDDRLRRLIDRGPSARSRSATPSTAAGSSALKLGYFYDSCMHDLGRLAAGGRELVGLVQAAVGPWYGLNPSGWTDDDGASTARSWVFEDALIAVQQHVGVFHETWVDKDRTMPGKNIMLLKSGGLGLYYMHYLTEDKIGVREAYKDYMRQIVQLLLRDANVTLTPSEVNARMDQFVADAYGLEEQLAAILRQVRTSGKLFVQVRTTIGGLDTDYPQLNYLRYLRGIFDDPYLDEDKPVMIQAPLYFRLLDDMLRNESDTHVRKRILNNYLVWRLAAQFAPELSIEYLQAGSRFWQAAYGVAEVPTTWRQCVTKVKTTLGSLLAWLYVRAHLAPDVKQQVVALYEDVRTSVTQRIGELTWMDEVTRSRAVEKIMSIHPVVGFDEIYYDNQQMEQIHSTLDIVRGQSYLKNVFAVRKWGRTQRIGQFLGDQPSSWHQHLPLLGWSSLWGVMSFYSHYTNTLVVPAGAIGDPLYETTRPAVFNYALLGADIASTLLYAVGERGSQIWNNGSLVRWWSNATNNEYAKKKDCFNNYFKDVTIGPLLINGRNITVPVRPRSQSYRTVGDLGAIRAGLRAYRGRAKSRPDALPVGLNMNADQLYFISLAQKYCFLRTDEARYRDAQRSLIPEDLELNTLLAHMPEFTDTFRCPLGSKMRVSDQCEVF